MSFLKGKSAFEYLKDKRVLFLILYVASVILQIAYMPIGPFLANLVLEIVLFGLIIMISNEREEKAKLSKLDQIEKS